MYIIRLADGTPFACGPESAVQYFTTRAAAQRWVEILQPEYPGCYVSQ